MNILTRWIRSYVSEVSVSDAELAEDLTLRGIAVEGIFPAACGGSRFEMDITTNRVDAMNHYGIAREAAAIYGVELRPLSDWTSQPTSQKRDVGHPDSDSQPTSQKRDVGHPRTSSDPTRPLRVRMGHPDSQSTSQNRDVGHPDSVEMTELKNSGGFPVRIEARDLCGRFTARVIRGVSVKAATGEIAEYFHAIGQKPISGPVDATNFGWLAMGQPTHVFDLDTIEGGIVVRRAKAGERLKLLDGSEHVLSDDDLVIADERKALSLAGVMGGWDSRVTETTKNILVEAAWFVPAAIRASSRRHGLHTDASHRFERGADFNAAPVGNNLVTRLVVEQAGGEVAGPMTDVVVPEMEAKTAGRDRIVLRVAEVQRILGTTKDDAVLEVPGQTGKRVSGLNESVVEQVLTALGCEMEATRAVAGEYAVKLPSWRLDLEREIDLIEEVARVYGYNRFADTLPEWPGAVVKQPHAEQEHAIRETMRALGYSEAISSTFVSAEEAAAFGDVKAGAVAMGNPLSEEAGMLRPSLAPGMATMLAHNLHRDVATVRLFEMGTVFTGSTAEVREATGLAIGATGSAAASALHGADDTLIFEVKGAVEALLAKFGSSPTHRDETAMNGAPGVSFDTKELPARSASPTHRDETAMNGAPGVSFDTKELPAWSASPTHRDETAMNGAPGVSFDAKELPAWIAAGRGGRALLDGEVVAVFGELSAEELQRRKLRQTCVIAEVAAQALLMRPLRQPVVQELSRYQAVERDFSFVFPDSVRWEAIAAAVDGLRIHELRSVRPVEIFRDAKGKAVAAGSYSLLTRVVFQSNERTLAEEELTGGSERVVAVLKGLGGVQRA